LIDVQRDQQSVNVLLLHSMVHTNAHPHAELGESVRLLVEAGADMNASDAQGCTALMCVCEASCCNTTLQVLLQNGADLKPSPIDGKTALHKAAAAGLPDSCELLLARDTSLVNVKDAKACTALMYAIASGSAETAVMLCEHGADVNTVTMLAFTPLSAACVFKQVGLAAFLIKAGASVHGHQHQQLVLL
jgi:ankyrin repeat protein